MNERPTDKPLLVILLLALAKLLIHLYTNAFAGYGIFRDEFYYLACSLRLDLGYVDQPPLSIYILKLSRHVFEDSVFAIRLIPAVAGALSVLFTGLLVRRLGGRTAAIVLACLAVMLAPIQLAMNTVYSMNSLDILLWVMAAYLVVLIITEPKPKWWVLLGLILGLGLLNKISVLGLGFGFFVALVLTKHRKSLKTRWPWVAGAMALVFFMPFIVWNVQHDFAHLEFIRNATMFKYSGITLKDFVIGQVLLQNPVTLPLWLAGLLYFLLHKQGKTFRMLGIIFVTVFLILTLSGNSKPEYLAPAFPMMFAGGAVWVENIGRRRLWGWLKYAAPALVAAVGMVLAPMTLPILPVQSFIKYSDALFLPRPSYEGKELTELHQFYADMFGWENLAATVAEVYRSLPEEEKKGAVVFARNYGEAGAIEYYSRKYDLPRVICGHNNYWLWGYGPEEVSAAIALAGERADYEEVFEQVEEAAVIRCRYCMPYENNLPVFVCRNLKVKLSDIWPDLKHYE